MTTEIPKVEFALGSEVSPGRFFKSAFARNFISSGRDCKSLDYELLDNAVVDERDDRNNNTRNNNFFSLVNFADDKPVNDGGGDAAVLWEQPKPKNEVNVCFAMFSFAQRARLLTVTLYVKYHAEMLQHPVTYISEIYQGFDIKDSRVQKYNFMKEYKLYIICVFYFIIN